MLMAGKHILSIVHVLIISFIWFIDVHPYYVYTYMHMFEFSLD